jgi:hypothetical protein
MDTKNVFLVCHWLMESLLVLNNFMQTLKTNYFVMHVLFDMSKVTELAKMLKKYARVKNLFMMDKIVLPIKLFLNVLKDII